MDEERKDTNRKPDLLKTAKGCNLRTWQVGNSQCVSIGATIVLFETCGELLKLKV
jgi:hypothetical protein